MFNKKIRESTLVSGVANEFFRIQGDSFDGDRSFLATLRALLHKRSHNAEIYLSVRTPEIYRFANLDATNVDYIFGNVTETPYGRDTLVIRNFAGSENDIAAAFRFYDDSANGFVKRFPQYQEMADLRVFVERVGKLNARFYINEEGHETVILCESLNFRTFHLLQSLIPRLLPWFFSEVPISEEEQSLLRSLTYRNATEYERILAELAERIDFREHLIRNIIGDYEKIGRRQEIENTKSKISQYRSEIVTLNRKYQEYLNVLDSLHLQLSGQEIALASTAEDSELIEYFVCNRNLTPVTVNGRNMSFTVKTFLESFDPDIYATYIRNERSHLFQGYNVNPRFNDLNVRRKFLDAIFSDDPILKVKVCSNYTINLNGNSSAQSGYYYSDDFIDYIPNPHIQYFACLGNYQRYINRALADGNIIGAVEQCVASAKSLNLAESPTTRHFLSDLFSSNHRIIRLPDGKDVTPADALKYLNDLETQEEVANV